MDRFPVAADTPSAAVGTCLVVEDTLLVVVGRELVVADTAAADSIPAAGWQDRIVVLAAAEEVAVVR